MKKSVLYLLVAVLLASAPFAAAQEDWLEQENLYGKVLIGFVTSWTPEEWLGDPAASFEEELIYVQSPNISGWMPVPEEGGSAVQYFGKGVRFVLNAPLVDATSEDSQTLVIYRPASLEIAPFERGYGSIVEIGADFVLLKEFADGAADRAPKTIYAAIDENTIAYMGDLPYTTAQGEEVANLLEVGDSCELIYDSETGIALSLQEMHG